MPRVISGAVAALVLVVLIAGAWWFTRSRAQPSPQVSSEAPREAPRESPPGVASTAPAADATDSQQEPAAQLPAIPAPTAAWLQAPANPLRVTLTVSEREAKERITPAGGTINATTSDGTRISLVFPPESLWRSEEITLRIVEAVGEAPFAAAPVAVSITPEDLPLRHSPVLQFEPGRRSGFDASGAIAGFAVRGGTELSLYPAVRLAIERAPGRYRMTMPLTRLGTYGVTTATDQEIATIGVREPSDLGARLDQRIALAYLTPAPHSGQPSPISAWTLFPRVHAQGGVSVFIYDLLKKLLEEYQQVVVPKFDKLPTSDCLSGAVFDAIGTYFQWRARVELLLPIQMPDRGPLDEALMEVMYQRVTMLRERGYTDQQIDEIDRAVGQFREQFDQMRAQIDARILPALSGQFGALYRCCTTQRPMMYHLTAMHKVLRFGEVNGYTPVDPDPMPKILECACMVGANQPGAEERFVGTVTYEQNTSFKKSAQQGQRALENTETLRFQQSSVLTFPSGDGMLTDSAVTGSLTRFGSTTDTYQSCVVHAELHEQAEGHDNDTGLVSINVNVPQGTYGLTFQPLPLEGSGSTRSVWNVSGPGCGKFNKPQDKIRFEKIGISPVPVTSVRGKLDPDRPTELKGSHVFEREDVFYNAIRTATLKWDLQRCKK